MDISTNARRLRAASRPGGKVKLNKKYKSMFRINKLFKILEHRFQADVTVWLSHIQFMKTSGWMESVSRIYLRMLQVRQH